jgi:hypothetical protein
MYCHTENHGGVTSSMRLLRKMFGMQEKKNILSGLYFARAVFIYSFLLIVDHEPYYRLPGIYFYICAGPNFTFMFESFMEPTYIRTLYS